MTGLVMTEIAMKVDGLRMYVRTLRKAKDISQGALADEIGLSPRAYQDWELGKTEKLEAGNLFRLVAHLQASVDDVRYFLEGDREAAEGAERARAWLARNPDMAVQIQEMIPRKDPEDLQRAIDDLRAAYARRTEVVGRFRSWLAGWQDRDTVDQ